MGIKSAIFLSLILHIFFIFSFKPYGIEEINFYNEEENVLTITLEQEKYEGEGQNYEVIEDDDPYNENGPSCGATNNEALIDELEFQ